MSLEEGTFFVYYRVSDKTNGNLEKSKEIYVVEHKKRHFKDLFIFLVKKSFVIR